MTEKMRIGVLGCGRVSARYREVLGQELAHRAEVIVAADLDIAKATAFTNAVGGAPVDSIEALIAYKPDLVCIMTESSAATTRTTISVIFAPRERISVKASWPGVSMKVMTLSATVLI